VVHGGTYNSQAVAMAATLATLRALADGSAIGSLESPGRRLMEGLGGAFRDAGITAVVAGFPQIFHVAFGLSEPPRNSRDLMRMDRETYARFTAELLKRRVRALERGAWFLSTEHDDAVIEATVDAARDAARAL
jgi:glutamate-1-semialdehyde 2,1-aminomutase